LKVAFDENVPMAMVRVFQMLAKEHRMLAHFGAFELQCAADYTPRPGQSGYLRNDDTPWIRRFAKAGGRVIISGDAKMRRAPHERLALVEEGMIVVFFENRWNNLRFHHKCSMLLHWWPQVADTIKKAKPPEFWCIPGDWKTEGKLRRLAHNDEKQLKIEQQLAAREPVARERARRQRPIDPAQIPLQLLPIVQRTAIPNDNEAQGQAGRPVEGVPRDGPEDRG
jgi:PIN like domain